MVKLFVLALLAIAAVSAYPQVILNQQAPDNSVSAGISINPYTQTTSVNDAYANGYHIGYQVGWNDALQYKTGSCGYYTDCRYSYSYPVFNQGYMYDSSYYYSRLHPVQGVIFDKNGRSSSPYYDYWYS